MAASEARIEIVGERRRAYAAEFRARLVAASLAPGAQVRELARRHGVCVSLIYRWRRSAAPARMARPGAQPGASGPTMPGKTIVAGPPLEFVPIGVFGWAGIIQQSHCNGKRFLRNVHGDC